MSRLLIAGDKQPKPMRLVNVATMGAPVKVPGKTTYPNSQAAVADLERMVADLGELHDHRLQLERRQQRLMVKLADPALAFHPKRDEAERRYEDLVREIADAEGRMQALMLVIGDVFVALPGEVQATLPIPPLTTRERMRIWLESCLAVGWLPHDEVPF